MAGNYGPQFVTNQPGYGDLLQFAIEQGPFEIVDFPNLKIRDDDFPVRHVCLPKGKIDGGSEPW